MLESIVARNIRVHLEKHISIQDSQHGFTTGRSCLTNLLAFDISDSQTVGRESNEGSFLQIVGVQNFKAACSIR